ncbi:MAG TPA: M48 family metallopeptidase [Rhodocyclaceae bacterium]
MGTYPSLETLTATTFAAFWLLALTLRLWLANRQITKLQGSRDQPPAVFAAEVSAQENAKAVDYGVDKARFSRWGTVSDAALVMALTFGGGLDLLSGLSAALTSSAIAGGIILLVLLALVNAIVDLPFAWHRQFVIEARHGFNRMTPALFLADLGKAALLSALLGIPLAWAALQLMASTGANWWLWVWALWSGFNLLLLWLYPAFIAPLFNSFRPLDDASLAARIEALLTRCGFRAGGLFVMDGSKRSSHGNAYFTGVGNKRRIVFFDTLLEKLSPAQVEAVLAHELGHFHHRHVLKRVALAILGAGLVLALMATLRESPWFFSGLGVNRVSDAAALIAFSLFFPLLLFPLQPLFNGLSRRDEFEADRYAVNQTSADSLQSALIQLYRDNAATLDPDRYHSRFFDSHPPAMERIARIRAAT